MHYRAARLESMTAPELSVVISALNEERTVVAVLSRVLAVLDREKIEGEIVFVDDRGDDRTGALADEIAGKDARVRVIHRPAGAPGNLGSALREGFRHSKGEHVVVLDCDLSHDPNEIPRLLALRGAADIVVGSRFVPGGRAEMPWRRVILTRAYNRFAKMLLGLAISDITTGYKLYKKKMLDDLGLESTGFGLQVEIVVKAHLKGYTAREVPIHYHRSDKKSTLIYRKQFASYTLPLFLGLKERLFNRRALTD